MSKKLCENCLTVTEEVKSLRIGDDKGSQRDPYWDSLDLCPPCTEPLVNHDLKAFHDRYAEKRLHVE